MNTAILLIVRPPFALALTLAFLLCSATYCPAQFETRASVSTYPDEAISIVTGDFNRDGKLDIGVIVDERSVGKLTIFLGNGDGTFRPGVAYPVATQPFYATAASLRNNGILDLVVGDSLTDDVYVMEGNGDGTFQPAVAYPTLGRPNVVSVADATGDGKLDIVALTEPAGVCNCVEVLPGNGDGTFGEAVITVVPYDVDGFALVLGNFNSDKKLDAAVSGGFGSADQVNILMGNGDGSFTPNGFYPVLANPDSIATGHFKNVDETDLVVTNGGALGVLLGNGDGTFQAPANYDTNFPSWVAVGDLDGDGKEDLVVANYFTPGGAFAGYLSVFPGNGDGTFQPGIAYPAGNLVHYVAIGDFNGDDKLDLVAVNQDSVVTLLNTGVVAFSPSAPLAFPTELVGTTTTPLITTLTNNGTSPLVISSVSFTGDPFHVQTTCHGTIPASGRCTIRATFTAAKKDVITGKVTIHDSASSKPQVVELVGIGTVVKLEPSQLTFAPQQNGTKSSPQSIKLTNTGSTALNFTRNIYIGGPDTGADFFESNNCPTSLSTGASCTIHVIFAPRMTGPFNASVVFTDDGGGLTQIVPLSGAGD